MSALPPPPPSSLPEIPEIPRRSRYRRPRRYVSWTGLIFGLLLGIAGGIYYAWNLAPNVEFDTAPWQLREADRNEYVVGVILQWSYDGDLGKAINVLLEMRLGDDPIQAVADIACQLASTGYVDSNSGRRAIRSMIQFYELQGRSGCASVLLPDSTQESVITIIAPTNTPTLPPPPSKTPTPVAARPTATLPVPFVPTVVSQRSFIVADIRTFCNAELSGIIEVRVRNFRGDPIPGSEIRVRWDTGNDTFFTGLKPERGMDYADFEMEPGKGYTVEMPGRSNPTQPLNAAPCNLEGGGQATTSFQVVFSEQ